MDMKNSRILSRAGVRPRSDITLRLTGTVAFAAFMAASAVWFKLYFTPVPVTLQVLGVILSGLVLGSRWGAASQLLYLTIGMMGLPVFSEFKAGPTALVGPTGGYLIGFVPAAYLTGWIFERLQGRTWLAAWAGSIAGITAIYLLGASWLAVWIGVSSAKPAMECLTGAWQLGIVPFIGIDLIKAAAASALVQGGYAGKRLIGNG